MSLDLVVTESEAERPGEHVPRLIVAMMDMERSNPVVADLRRPLDDHEIVGQGAKDVPGESLDVHLPIISRAGWPAASDRAAVGCRGTFLTTSPPKHQLSNAWKALCPHNTPMADEDITRSLLLVHGAGSGPWVYDGWAESFPGIDVAAVDLQQGRDVETLSHADYASSVIDAAGPLPRPVPLCGWSMGGLVVLQAAERVRPHSVILLEPSPPAEIQGYHPETQTAEGAFDPELVYGRFPAGIPARPESSRARADRKRGISVPTLPCPSLVVYGDDFREERGQAVAGLYGSDELDFPGLDHWALVRDPRVRRKIAAWLGGTRNARRLRSR